MRAAAATFRTEVAAGGLGRGLAGKSNSKVYSPIESGLLLLESGGRLTVLFTTHFVTHYYRLSNYLRRQLAEALAIGEDQILTFSSHNHSSGELLRSFHGFWGEDGPESMIARDDLGPEGLDLLDQTVATARRLAGQLEEVTVAWGCGNERRITHNRKGRRADGSTYLMREADRLLLGADFNGDIDDDAFLVGFYGKSGKPVCFVTQFTGHPVTSYHPEDPIVHGEFPQVACEVLSAGHGSVPVLFLQGCAGDVNAKGLLSGKAADERVADTEHYGRLLGETFLKVSEEMRPCRVDTVSLRWCDVELPFKDVPPEEELRRRLGAVDEFMKRCDAGDDAGTRVCDGLNFPANLTPAYRKALVEPTRAWLNWVLRFHGAHPTEQPPTGVSLRIATLKLGELGIVGFPCEPLLEIGRRVKRLSPLAVTIPCGYMNDTRRVGYVPDGPNANDLDYVSSSYRYTRNMLPYRWPAGDALADAAVALLKS